jgi:hypothetical protein
MNRIEPIANGNRQLSGAIQLALAKVLGAVLTACEETANAARI